MATQIQGKRAVSVTTDAHGGVDLIVLTEPGFGVAVTNVSGTVPLWFTVSEPGGPCIVPTVGGTTGEWCSASVAGNTVEVRHQAQFGTVVQVIAASVSCQYQVAVLGARINA